MMLLALSAPAVAVSCSKDPGKEQTDDKTTDTGNTPSGPQNPGDASIINIKAGEDLQAALDGAAAGTIVRVQGGVTFKGQFKMRDGVQLSGGWDAAFTKADPDNNKTVLDGNNAGRILAAVLKNGKSIVKGLINWRSGHYADNAAHADILLYIKKQETVPGCPRIQEPRGGFRPDIQAYDRYHSVTCFRYYNGFLRK